MAQIRKGTTRSGGSTEGVDTVIDLRQASQARQGSHVDGNCEKEELTSAISQDTISQPARCHKPQRPFPKGTRLSTSFLPVLANLQLDE